MAETPIAEFPARLIPAGGDGSDPVGGRVVMTEERLRLRTEDCQVDIPHSDIFDVVVGRLPVGVSAFADDTVAIGYETDATRRTVIVGTDSATITRFRTVLFRAILDGSTVWVIHPAAVGGRRTEMAARDATLHLERQAVTFGDLEEPIRIDLSRVTSLGRTQRTVDNRSYLALEVQFTEQRQAVTTEVLLESGRQMNLLGRFLRLEYSDLVAELADLDLVDHEVKLLTALYSGASQRELSTFIPAEYDRSSLVQALEEKRLVAPTDSGIRLTSLGRMAVSDQLDTINA